MSFEYVSPPHSPIHKINSNVVDNNNNSNVETLINTSTTHVSNKSFFPPPTPQKKNHLRRLESRKKFPDVFTDSKYQPLFLSLCSPSTSSSSSSPSCSVNEFILCLKEEQQQQQQEGQQKFYNKDKNEDNRIKSTLLGAGDFGKVHLVQVSPLLPCSLSSSSSCSPLHYSFALKTQIYHSYAELHIYFKRIKLLERLYLYFDQVWPINIVKHFYVWSDDMRDERGPCLLIQMEWCKHGNLEKWWNEMLSKSSESSKFSREKYIIQILIQILEALKSLHACSILHLDIKPTNIMVTENEKQEILFKLSDFGTAYDILQEDKIDLEEGDGRFLAPEILTSKSELLTGAVDIFSLGQTIHHLIYSYCVQFESESNNITKYGWNDQHLSSISVALQNIISSMLSLDHSKRPSIALLLIQLKEL